MEDSKATRKERLYSYTPVYPPLQLCSSSTGYGLARRDLIPHSWNNANPSGSPISIIAQKLKPTKMAIKEWLDTHRDDNNGRLRSIENSIRQLDVHAESTPLSSQEIERKNNLRQEHYNILLYHEIV